MNYLIEYTGGSKQLFGSAKRAIKEIDYTVGTNAIYSYFDIETRESHRCNNNFAKNEILAGRTVTVYDHTGNIEHATITPMEVL